MQLPNCIANMTVVNILEFVIVLEESVAASDSAKKQQQRSRWYIHVFLNEIPNSGAHFYKDPRENVAMP
jgi:hypothetical protein